MVRVFIKGGVWKNSEDEILKAAVMKYGKQQWARVASLLNRKTAKQCKARWHEWLDPSVKKVEWSRQEEEKLLHLAKLMPAQWKTIGPLVGRTATQCQEHYELLLDQATGNTGDARKQQDGTAASLSLQAGQIDSHPETKPARPDPIDMDEDEMEMLQEARARLANTQGKKAKRKAREKMLHQAKRLADLQKRRELKQAGLLSSSMMRTRVKRKEIDLGVEIPFHKPAPAGFHDTASEDRMAESQRRRRMGAVHYQRVNENQHKTREREAVRAQKREEARVRNLERSNMQYVVAQVSKTNDPLSIRNRSALDLPEPRVSSGELGQLAKIQQQQQQDNDMDGGTTVDGVTQALLTNYSDRPLPTPASVAGATSSSQKRKATHETLMHKASQLRRLEEGQTPLLGAVAAPGFKTTGLEEEDEEQDEDDNAMEEQATAATPRLPSRLGNQTPLAPRDQLGLNTVDEDDNVSMITASTFRSIRDLAREERRAAKRARKELEDALAALPAPQFEYELAAPEANDNDDENDAIVETVVPDAADLDAAERQRRRAEAEKLYRARSSVVKRPELPRPVGAIPPLQNDDDSMSNAERLVRQEMWQMLRHDAFAFPVPATGGDDKKKKKKKKKSKQEEEEAPTETPLELIPEDDLDMAKELVDSEMEKVLEEKLSIALSSGTYSTEREALDAMVKANTEASSASASNLAYVTDAGLVGTESSDNTIAALRTEFGALQEATASLRKRNDKLETKLSVKHGGYAKRQQTLGDQLLQDFATLANCCIEEAVFGRLQSQEVRGGEQRIEQLGQELVEAEANESQLQKRYGDLLLERKRLYASLRRAATTN